MNKLVYGVLAATLVTATGTASENEWSSLDQEIEALSASLNQTDGGPELSGWIQTSWRASDDDATQVPFFDTDNAVADTGDLQGFFLDSVRVAVDGEVGNYGYRVEYDFTDPSTIDGDFEAGLLDAYIKTMFGDTVSFMMGNFRQPFVGGALLRRDRLLFLERSGIDQTYSVRDQGVQIGGEWETVGWHIAAQNGSDGVADEYLFTGRVEVDVLGGGVGDIEGAWGAPEDVALTVGGGLMDDGQVDNGFAWAVDAALTAGPFYAAATLIDYDDGVFAQSDSVIGLNPVDGTTPWNATASYLFTDMYEAAFRYEDSDDSDDSTAWTAAINRYVQGHDIKWTIEYRDVSTDNAIDDFQIWGVGLSLSY